MAPTPAAAAGTMAGASAEARVSGAPRRVRSSIRASVRAYDDSASRAPFRSLVSMTMSKPELTSGKSASALLKTLEPAEFEEADADKIDTAAAFDLDVPTSTNYRAAELCEYGPYKDVREGLDRTYHGSYTRQRQRVQDEIIGHFVRVGVAQQRPWLIYTAGPMGAGKSWTLEWLWQRGIFPLDEIVHLDADLVKAALPEWDALVERSPLTAGGLTRRESGYLVEIAQEVAMRARKHVWVDGSLRDGEWYEGAFRRLRIEHPDYRIAILAIFAERDVIFERVRARAKESGRDVPADEVEDSIRRVPLSVSRLSPHVDFKAIIDNSGETPQLRSYQEGRETDEIGPMCTLNRQGSASWSQMQRRFGSHERTMSRRLSKEYAQIQRALLETSLVGIPERSAEVTSEGAQAAEAAGGAPCSGLPNPQSPSVHSLRTTRRLTVSARLSARLSKLGSSLSSLLRRSARGLTQSRRRGRSPRPDDEALGAEAEDRPPDACGARAAGAGVQVTDVDVRLRH